MFTSFYSKFFIQQENRAHFVHTSTQPGKIKALRADVNFTLPEFFIFFSRLALFQSLDFSK